MDEADAMGTLLAERHSLEVEASPTHSLLNYAESPRTGDWSLRSALVRLAQPEPLRSSAVVELIRRLDAALHPFVRALQRRGVVCDRRISMGDLLAAGDRWQLREQAEPVPDARVADLARLAHRDAEAFDRVLAAYTAVHELHPEEREALPLVRVAVALDVLADQLATWAAGGFVDPPVDDVDRAAHAIFGELGDLGVPQEAGPPSRGGRSG